MKVSIIALAANLSACNDDEISKVSADSVGNVYKLKEIWTLISSLEPGRPVAI